MTQETSNYRAKKAGTLPETPAPEVNGIRLPSGSLISPDPDLALPPVLWISSEPVRHVGSIWRQLAAAFPTHGLWPLVLESLPDDDDDRPWLPGELDPTASTSPDEHDLEEVLAGWWNDSIPVEDEGEDAFEELAPFGREFPGLAPASQSALNTYALDSVTAQLTGRLGLVACTRPADVVMVIGWQGPVNCYSDMGQLSAVLRSWEDRFGAFVVGIGFDTLTLAVQRPPDDLDLALAIAAEYFAACSDNIYQGAGDIKTYAEGLIGQSFWTFWWD